MTKAIVVGTKAEEEVVVAAVVVVTKAAILVAVVVEMKVATKARLHHQSQVLLRGHLNHQGRQSHQYVQRVHLTAPLHLHLHRRHHVIQLQIASVLQETVPKTLMTQNAALIVPKTLMSHDVCHVHQLD